MFSKLVLSDGDVGIELHVDDGVLDRAIIDVGDVAIGGVDTAIGIGGASVLLC